jgi:hypothetical protein
MCVYTFRLYDAELSRKIFPSLPQPLSLSLSLSISLDLWSANCYFSVHASDIPKSLISHEKDLIKCYILLDMCVYKHILYVVCALLTYPDSYDDTEE